jgi:NADH:ubiquinone oxidoreductase subunit E
MKKTKELLMDMQNEEEQMAHNGLNGLTQTQTAVEWLVNEIESKNGKYFTSYFIEFIDQAKEMEIKQAHEYAKFAIICDRKDIKILNFDGYINLKNTEQ